MTIHPIDQIEPGAITRTNLIPDLVDAQIDDLHIQLSIAISLKRIADVLDGSAVGLNINETMFGKSYR